MKRFTLFLTFFYLCFCVSAQVAIGKWRSNLPYRSFKSVAVSSQYIYAVTNSDMVYFSQSDNNLYSLNKVDGLNDIGVTLIRYAPSLKTLIIAYDNCNIDLIVDGEIYNIADIKSKSLNGIKTINNIYINGNEAYICCSFGVVVLDLSKMVVLDSWYVKIGDNNLSVNDIDIYKDQYYMATDSGLYYTSFRNPAPADFSSWIAVDTFNRQNIQYVFAYNQQLYICKRTASQDTLTDTLYKYLNPYWMNMEMYGHREIQSYDVKNNLMLLCYNADVSIYNTNEHHEVSCIWSTETYCDAEQAVLGSDSLIWVADIQNGLVKINYKKATNVLYQGSGPYSEMVYRLSFGDQTLALVPGSNENYAPNYWGGDYSYYKDNEWIYHAKYMSSLTTNWHNPCAIAVNPDNSTHIYAGSWGAGIIHYKEGEPQIIYNADNSTLQNYTSNNECYVSDLGFDSQHQLWVAQSRVAKILSVKTDDNQWYSYSLSPYAGSGTPLVKRIFIDSKDNKWLCMHNNNAYRLVVFSENGTLGTTSDDKVIGIDMNSAANISTELVYCVTEDLDGEIWIGTEQGIKVIYNPQNIYAGNVYPQNILIEQNGYVQNLLEYESITAIAVDGANRKWIGTSKAGIFLISKDGTEELLHFTEDNSPLFSNEIKDIVINPYTGEVYIGTSKGLVSYMGDATYGSEDYSKVQVFPNPVRPDYTGKIAIRGLVQNSYFKITDVSGNIVYQNYANGSEGIWDGTLFSGKKATTGVYFIMAIDKNGKMRHVAKVVFIQ